MSKKFPQYLETLRNELINLDGYQNLTVAAFDLCFETMQAKVSEELEAKDKRIDSLRAALHFFATCTNRIYEDDNGVTAREALASDDLMKGQSHE